MLTIYVIAHYVARRNGPDSQGTDATIRLVSIKIFSRIYYVFLYLKIRLIFTIVFNICFVPLAILVIQDYRRDEFSKRLIEKIEI